MFRRDQHRASRRIHVWGLALCSCSALADSGLDQDNPGRSALRYRKETKIWYSVDSEFVDGQVTTSPLQSVKYDRRLTSVSSLGFDLATERLGLRANAKAYYVRRRVADAEAPKTFEDTEFGTALPSVDITFVTDKGLELFFGKQVRYTPKYTRRTDTPGVDTNTEFGKSRLQSSRLGIVRRASGWAGGLYYVSGDEGTRKFEAVASDESRQTGEEEIFDPPRLGVIVELLAGTLLYDLDFELIQARGKGPKDSRNRTAYTDSFAVRSHILIPLGAVMHMQLGAAHQTMAYANSANINLDTIPRSTVRTGILWGDRKNYGQLGFAYSEGQDGQSLPEFNAKYRLRAYAISLGILVKL